MKHISIFEEYSDKLPYQQITYTEYLSQLYGSHTSPDINSSLSDGIEHWNKKRESFTEKEYSIIDKMFKDKQFFINKEPSTITINWKWKIYKHIVTIDKMKDEWYYIKLIHIYYKCDQFDGLIQCLKDKLNIW